MFQRVTRNPGVMLALSWTSRGLRVARPDPPGLCSELPDSVGSVRFPNPEPLWYGTSGCPLSCVASRELRERLLLLLERRCGPRPCRSAPRPTYFPNLWPCFYSTPVVPKCEMCKPVGYASSHFYPLDGRRRG